MALRITSVTTAVLLATQLSFANPYWDQTKVPLDKNVPLSTELLHQLKNAKIVHKETLIDVLRIQVDWLEQSDSYTFGKLVIEPSGTQALLARSRHSSKWGSYRGVLKDKATGKAVYFDSIGTGKEYRKLARAINLRFPLPTSTMTFELFAENPQSGVMEKVIEKDINPADMVKEIRSFPDLVVKELALAAKSPSLRVNIYAEGFRDEDKAKFWRKAAKTVEILQREHFPGIEYMSFYAVFNPSNTVLGGAGDLGLPVPDYDSFLGLYFPYWDDFGRWYHIVYPTNENKFRQGLAAAPYDYPLVLVNNNDYWGVGNFRSHTAIPASYNGSYTYLLLHELGHFFGLNEEYTGGGRTELEFAPDIEEPWSQNITFLPQPNYLGLKWAALANPFISIPTPDFEWHFSPPNYGAYSGAYADSTSTRGVSYKPGLWCVMEDKGSFCDICKQAIRDVVLFDLGLSKD